MPRPSIRRPTTLLTVLWLGGFAAGSVHAAIAFVQEASGNASSSSTVTATFTSTPISGNLLVAVAGIDGSIAATTPSGWSVAIDETGNSPGQVIYYRIAGASEDTAVAVTFSASGKLGLHIYEYSGIDRSAPLDRTASNSGSSNSPSTGTTATTTRSSELLVAGFVIKTGASFSGWTNSFTEQNDFTAGGGVGFGGADRILTGTGTWSTAATASASATWRGQLATFRAHRRVIIIAGR